MADIRDWVKFQAGRWQWQAFGYEKAFPRGIGFSDVDAIVEVNGRFLLVECKHHTGSGLLPQLPRGQELMLRRLSALPDVAVFVLYGDAKRNLPYAARRFRHHSGMPVVDFFDWREDPEGVGRAEWFRLLAQFVDWADGGPLGVGA